MYVDDQTRLRHMLDTAREAVGFARGHSRAELDDNRLLRRGLVSCLQEIGEAASRVSLARRDQTPAIPWDWIIGLRHRAVHDYVNIRLDIVWDTVVDDLPALISTLETIV